MEKVCDRTVQPSWHFKSQEKSSYVRNQAVCVSLLAELDHPHLNRNVWKLHGGAIVVDSRRIVTFDHPLRHLVRRTGF
jgi:hypothetical protein